MSSLLIHIWFAGSVILYMAVDFTLRRFLRRKDVLLTWFWLGTPGYLDMKYAEWCKKNQKSSAPVFILRFFLLTSIIFSAVFFKAAIAHR
jgi:hypothetical protein